LMRQGPHWKRHIHQFLLPRERLSSRCLVMTGG
jgi:hypothetical protein